MKNFNTSSMFKMTIVALLLCFIGVQYAQAQLTIVNNTNSWIVVGEKEGPSCQECNNSQGTWIPPVSFAPGNQATFLAQCPAGLYTSITPTPPPPPGFEYWIGVKYGMNATGPTPNVTAAGTTYNPFYIPFPCGPPNPGTTWIPGANGSATVIFN